MKRYVAASKEIDKYITISANGETVKINPYYAELIWEGHDNGGQYNSWTDLILDLKDILTGHKKY